MVSPILFFFYLTSLASFPTFIISMLWVSKSFLMALFSLSWFLMHARIWSNLSCFLGSSGFISTPPTTSSFSISPRNQQAPSPSVPVMTSHSFSLPGTNQFWLCTSAAPNPWIRYSRKHVRPIPRQQINSRKRIIHWNTTSWKRVNPSSRQEGIAANPALPVVTRSGFISEWMGFFQLKSLTLRRAVFFQVRYCMWLVQ